MKFFLRRAFYLLCVLAVFLLLFNQRKVFQGILITLIYACLFTVILAPLCARMERAGISGSVSSALSIILIVILIFSVVSILLPQIIIQSTKLVKQCLPVLQDISMKLVHAFSGSSLQAINLSGMLDGAANGLSKAAGIFARRSIALAAETGRLAFSMIISYYILKERVVLGYYLLLLLPSKWREYALLACKASKNAILGYLSSVLKTSIFVGVSTGIGLCLLGINGGLFLGFMMGVLETLPYIGPLIGAIPILLSAVPLGMPRMMYVITLVILIQQAESSFVGPYFTSASTSIHPLTALLSVYILGSLAGIWGIMLAIPIVLSLQSVFWSFTQYRNLSKA